MINLKAAAKTALLVAIVLLIGDFILTYPLLFAKIIFITVGAWSASVIYRWFDDTDESKTK